jgi:NAD(P)-dependent dehydrogenase (short-subunit alcohol dehydrogenase family)
MSAELFSLAGRTALVTGGGSGIGQAIAHALSDAGARIVLAGRREERLRHALGHRAGDVLPLDLLAPDAPREAAGTLAGRGHSPDILVNAAGANPRLPADEIPRAAWNETLTLNLSVPFFMAQALVPAMRDRGWGRIVNIASLQSVRAFPGGTAYGASKGGIAQLTRAMAADWSPRGINVNAIAPGFFPTALTAPVFGDAERASASARATCIGRNGEMEDLVGPLLFLCSEASRYVTGQLLFVDGGFTAR